MVVGLNAGVITVIMLVARIRDAVNDPMMGVIADHTPQPLGQPSPLGLLCRPSRWASSWCWTFTNVGLTGAAKDDLTAAPCTSCSV